MQNFVLNRNIILGSKTLLRYAFKQRVSAAPLNYLVTRNYSLYTPDSKAKQLNNLIFGNTVGTCLLQSQLNVNSFGISRRFLSDGFGKAEDLSNQVLPNSSQNIIDLTQGSSEELLKSLTQPLSDVPITALGLASNYLPIGWCLHYLEMLHSFFPWWATIVLATVSFRIVTFPLAIMSQRYSAKMNAMLPEQKKLQEKLQEARMSGDEMEYARLTSELHSIFKRHDIKPVRSMIFPMAQVPVFLTFFLTLRRMANHPVESLKDGGFYWVMDLSIPDPLYALPTICSLLLWASLEISFRSGQNPNQNVWIKYGIRVIPLVTFLFTCHFPAAIMTYWCANNFISTLQVVALKQPAVRAFFKIPQIKVNPMDLKFNKKNVRKHWRDQMDNVKIRKIMEDRKTIDEMNFRKAGIGPLKKTFKIDPTRAKSES